MTTLWTIKRPKLKPALGQFLQWLKDIIAVGDKEMEEEQDRSDAETQPVLVPATQATETANGSMAREYVVTGPGFWALGGDLKCPQVINVQGH